MRMQKYKLTILGLGNVLFRDEGFGVHFIQYFQSRNTPPDNILIADGGTLGYMLLNIICQTEYLFVIDTVKADDKPGSIYRFHPKDIPAKIDYTISAHEVEFMDILQKSEMMGEAPITTFITVVPEDILSEGMELTKTLQGCLPEIEKLVLEEIEKIGLPLFIRQGQP